jgi:methionyl-tRNA formyltransferase
MRSVFFGTPDFAVPALRALMGEGFDVVAVVTQPDRPQGRSRSHLISPPVKVVAEEEGLPVLQPERPSAPEFVEQYRALEPDIGIVVAYGHILKPAVLAVPRLGMVNVHASLLPKLRGAAPIEHTILQGHEMSGVSIMQMDAGMDTGPVLHAITTPIAPDETGGELLVRLAELGALALVEALALIATDSIARHIQDDEHATYAPKVTRDLTRIRWDEPSERIARQVRAFDPKPGAWTMVGDLEVKLFGPLLADDYQADDRPGEVLETDPAFVVASGDGALQFLDVQPAGKQRMAAKDWLRGRGLQKGDLFG